MTQNMDKAKDKIMFCVSKSFEVSFTNCNCNKINRLQVRMMSKTGSEIHLYKELRVQLNEEVRSARLFVGK